MTRRRRYSEEDLGAIYDRTSGKCHVCHKKLAFNNYGLPGERAAWEVDHSRAVARGGSDHLNNLFAACVPCNRSKGTVGARSARARSGTRRAPLSVAKRRSARNENTVAGGALGAALGGVLGGPPGAFLGGVLGAAFGNSSDPDEP